MRDGLRIPREAPVVGFVGRVVRDKGIVDLIEAWQHLRRADNETHLLVVGRPEPDDPAARMAIETLRRDSRAHVVGFMREPEQALAAMTVLVLPSHREGFGLAALEASAMGKPVVATRVTGLTDAVIDGLTGTVVEPARPRALAGAIQRYIDDVSLSEQHGLAGRLRAEREFDRGRVVAALGAAYVDALIRSRRSA